MATADVVIVGAGSAGCVLAARLSEDPGRRVVLLEAGGSHMAMNVRAPGLYYSLWRTPRDWAFGTEPQANVDGRTMFWPRGKVIGGSGSLNASVYIRGNRADYDAWRDAGNAGWGWDDVLPYFKRAQDQARGASSHHGIGGPLRVEDQGDRCAAAEAFVAALAARCRLPRIDDFNRGDPEGAGFYQVTTRGGERWSSARGYLDPARARDNLTVVTGAHVLGLRLDGTRATGVRYRAGGRDETVSAGEIVLCGGAIGSPHLLLLSGIGPADHLRAHGVEVRAHLPGVGQNLQDHLLVPVMFDVKAGTPGLSRLGIARDIARFLLGRRGPYARTPLDAGGFVRSAPDCPHADLQFHFIPFGSWPNFDRPHPLDFAQRVTLYPTLIYPKSRGEVRLRSADPTAAPAIDPRYLSDGADLELLVSGMRLARDIAAEAPLRDLVVREIRPGPEVRDDAGLRAAVRHHTDTVFHPTSTCKMGPGDDAVVDSQLRVRGIEGLRVADASIMPDIVGGNTNAPTIMIAEKAADLIRGR